MYSYSVNPDFAANGEVIIRSLLNTIFSENAQTVIVAEEAEYEEPCISSADKEDVYKSRQGNHEAYKRLIERHQQAIAKIMWRFSRDKQTHEELVHDVFVEAYLSLATYRKRAPFSHWLSRIAVRVGYRYWKEQSRQNHRKRLSIKEWDQVLAEPDVMESEQAGELVHNLLEQLPPRDRLVLTLRFLEGCDVAQTAYRTGWSRSMVKVQTLRAKRKLKKMFPNA